MRTCALRCQRGFVRGGFCGTAAVSRAAAVVVWNIYARNLGTYIAFRFRYGLGVPSLSGIWLDECIALYIHRMGIDG